MSELNYQLTALLLTLWFIRTSAALSEATYFWQLKEYRWDRMKQFLFEQKGHQYFINSFHVLYIVIALAYLISWSILPNKFEAFVSWFPLIAGVLFLSEGLRFLHLLFTRKLKRPKVTLKSVSIFFASFLLELLIIAGYWWYSGGVVAEHFLSLVLILLITVEFDLHAFFVSAFNVLSRQLKRNIFRRAQKKRLMHKDLIVIGITGSFGKTSVKEYLSHILSGKYRVLKTKKNINTEIGIAKIILQDLQPEHQVFVCEMGAYSKGEIRLCSQIAIPKIGIFTGLNNQHAALFGSIDDTFKAKWELVQSLPSDGLTVINGDSDELLKRVVSTHSRTIICSAGTGDAVAENITTGTDFVEFTYGGQKFMANLIGSFQVINLLMCIVVAESLGMPLTQIAEKIKTISPPDKTMVPVEFSRGLIIDDSYNVNPDGLKQALLHLDSYTNCKKILVLPGILELGNDSERLHEEIGELIGRHLDYVFFTDLNFSEALTRGALRGGLTRQHIFDTQEQDQILKEINDLLQEYSSHRFVLLFESRGAEKVIQGLV